MACEGEPALDGMIDPGAVLQAEEALGRALAGEEFVIALVDVRGDELGAFGVGARDHQRRHPRHVGGQPCGLEVADMRLGRDLHLAADMAALLFRGGLIRIMDIRGARGDIRAEEPKSELQSLMRISYSVLYLKKKNNM